MPEYSYVCDKCSSHMEVVCSIREYDKMQKNLRVKAADLKAYQGIITTISQA